MGITANAVTNQVGDTIYISETCGGIKTGEVGHGVSKDIFEGFEPTRTREMLFCEMETISTRYMRICETLADFGFKGSDVLSVKDNSKKIVRLGKNKDGSEKKNGWATPSIISIDINYHGKDISIFSGRSVCKVAVKDGAGYRYYTNTNLAKRALFGPKEKLKDGFRAKIYEGAQF